LHWARHAASSTSLADAVRTAVDMALRGTAIQAAASPEHNNREARK
jgi:hypothetical protein